MTTDQRHTTTTASGDHAAPGPGRRPVRTTTSALAATLAAALVLSGCTLLGVGDDDAMGGSSGRDAADGAGPSVEAMSWGVDLAPLDGQVVAVEATGAEADASTGFAAVGGGVRVEYAPGTFPADAPPTVQTVIETSYDYGPANMNGLFLASGAGEPPRATPGLPSPGAGSSTSSATSTPTAADVPQEAADGAPVQQALQALVVSAPRPPTGTFDVVLPFHVPDGGTPPANPVVMAFDDHLNTLIPLPTQVDAEQQVLRARTDRLTRFHAVGLGANPGWDWVDRLTRAALGRPTAVSGYVCAEEVDSKADPIPGWVTDMDLRGVPSDNLSTTLLPGCAASVPGQPDRLMLSITNRSAQTKTLTFAVEPVDVRVQIPRYEEARSGDTFSFNPPPDVLADAALAHADDRRSGSIDAAPGALQDITVLPPTTTAVMTFDRPDTGQPVVVTAAPTGYTALLDAATQSASLALAAADFSSDSTGLTLSAAEMIDVMREAMSCSATHLDDDTATTTDAINSAPLHQAWTRALSSCLPAVAAAAGLTEETTARVTAAVEVAYGPGAPVWQGAALSAARADSRGSTLTVSTQGTTVPLADLEGTFVGAIDEGHEGDVDLVLDVGPGGEWFNLTVPDTFDAGRMALCQGSIEVTGADGDTVLGEAVMSEDTEAMFAKEDNSLSPCDYATGEVRLTATGSDTIGYRHDDGETFMAATTLRRLAPGEHAQRPLSTWMVRTIDTTDPYFSRYSSVAKPIDGTVDGNEPEDSVQVYVTCDGKEEVTIFYFSGVATRLRGAFALPDIAPDGISVDYTVTSGDWFDEYVEAEELASGTVTAGTQVPFDIDLSQETYIDGSTSQESGFGMSAITVTARADGCYSGYFGGLVDAVVE